MLAHLHGGPNDGASLEVWPWSERIEIPGDSTTTGWIYHVYERGLLLAEIDQYNYIGEREAPHAFIDAFIHVQEPE